MFAPAHATPALQSGRPLTKVQSHSEDFATDIETGDTGMADNTRLNIQSNAQHAVVEAQGILANLDDADHIWRSVQAAMSRLTYITTLLTEGGYPNPGP